MDKSGMKFVVFLVVLLLLLASVNALTAAIGNARMIINYTLEKNKENILQRSILVKNTNNASVLVNLKPAGDLEDITTIPDNNITLAPDTDKDFTFLVTLSQPGELDGKINVFFTDPEGKQSGLVLSSNIVIYVLGEGTVLPKNNQTTVTSTKNETKQPVDGTVDNSGKTPVTVSVGGAGNAAASNNDANDSGINWFFVAFIILMSAIFVAIIIFMMKRS